MGSFSWACWLITFALTPIRQPIEPQSQGAHRAYVHGVVNVCSAVVRTTETMAIYWEFGTYRQRRYFSTKRGRACWSRSWAAPATCCGRKRAGCRFAESSCGVWSWRWNSGTLHITHSDWGISQTKTVDVNKRTGGPVPTREEDRGVRRNGPRRHAARLRVLSSEPIGARDGRRELELQAASARRLAELQLR